VLKKTISFHLRRRVSQAIAVLLAVLIPATGLFRFDMEVGGFVVLDRQIWFSDFFLIAGLWVFLVSLLVLLYSSAGTVFCGWACPQNILSEWANYMTQRYLGKKAQVSLDGELPIVQDSKNKIINWMILGLSFTAVSMFVALIPLLYFYPPEVVWSFVIWRPDPHLARSLHWIYFVFTLVILLDISVIRHFWCRFACVYRVWQHSFKTRETLHVRYDPSRSFDCVGCNFCEKSCFIELNPRQTDIYDSCINCGECIDACQVMHLKKGQSGLLSFEWGERTLGDARAGWMRNAMNGFRGRLRWIWLLACLGLFSFTYGYLNWEPLHLAVYAAEIRDANAQRDYRIAITNKQLKSTHVNVLIQGLSNDEYQLEGDDLTLAPAAHASLHLRISDQLPQGLHRFEVIVQSQSDPLVQLKFRVEHLSMRVN
jgi:polyferredoxin